MHMQSRWLVVFYSLMLSLGILIALPNLFTAEQIEHYAPFLPDTRVILGLDLQGGSSLLLEIDTEALKRERLRTLLEKIRNILRHEQIRSLSVRIIGNDIIAAFTDEEDQRKAFRAFESAPIFTTGASSTSLKEYTLAKEEKALRLSITDDILDYYRGTAIDRSLEIIRQRVDKFGVTEPSIQKIGKNRIQVQLPGVQNPGHLRTLLGTTAKMSFHLVHHGLGLDPLNPPVGISILPGYKEGSVEQYAVEDKISLDGAMLETAFASFAPGTNRPIIEFSLNSSGAKEFAKITRENLGKNFVIVLDNKVLTAPVIKSVIPNGRGQITGNFTVAETITLSALLRAGALPVSLKIIEERTVGPDLGADAIRMGLCTGVFGFILVTVFIFLLYGMWGLIADLALALHTVLTFSALSILGATLTLPGIAGIILGIGVAVDANILINERIREESCKGAGALASLDRGFRHAFSTIIDANVTIVIATCLLYQFGTGPVRGFAVTMLIGIILSMFTDITLVRIVMHSIIRRKGLKILHIQPFLNFVPQRTNFSFMSARFIGLAISLLFSAASIFLFFKPGLNYGIDFKGGIQMELSNEKKIDLSVVRSRLFDLHVGEITLQTLDNDQSVMLRLQHQEEGEEKEFAVVSAIRKTLAEIYPESIFQKTEIVGPKISSELAKTGLIAVILASSAMVFYIWWRFEWFFALGALVTLILDTTKMLGIFVIFRFDFNLTAIAALMTIVGYSINDKIVVYDRMRENLRLYRKKTLREIIDMSINQVFVRCLFTSATTVLAMLPMVIWGGNAVYNFSLPVVIGILIATLSSIFIAAPVLLFLGDLRKKYI